MELNIEKNELLNAMYKIQGIVDKKHTIPILSNVLIKTVEEQIIIEATDLEIGVQIFCKCDVVSVGDLSISAKKLFEILKELPDDIINIKSKDNHWVEMRCGKTLFNIVGLPTDDFPKFNEISSDKIELKTDLLADLIDKTIYSVSNDETKYNLNGIFVVSETVDNNNFLKFVSTDGHRLSLCKKLTKLLDNHFLEQGFILPKKGILELRKILDHGSEVIYVKIDKNYLSINTDKTYFIMRMIDGEFPEYKKVIPEKTANYATINRHDFLQVLKRISVIANDKSKGVKFSLKANNLNIVSSNPDLGDANEDLLIDYNGNQIDIGFNAKYIIDILNHIDEEKIKFYIKDNISPGMITQNSNDEFLAVIMPMRL